MDNTASFSMVIITLALVFYSIGVWGIFFSRRLQWRHLVFFVLGLICDTWGTTLMVEMADGLSYDIHGISGLLAIVLMFIHAGWAFIVLLRKEEKAIRNFHKFSVLIWLIWLVPYFSPMVFQLAPP
jgi:uncharacterized repeat protein (TIGR03987 family)